MSELLNRVKSLPNICGIEVAFTGALLPSTIDGYQVFSNSIPSGTDFQAAYAGKASVTFNEDSSRERAGTVWSQKLVFRFPSTDQFRADRLELLDTLKFVKIRLTNRKHIVLGRNDFEQNALPVVDFKSNDKLTQMEVVTRSISPSGYVPPLDAGGLPVFFPIEFVNPD